MDRHARHPADDHPDGDRPDGPPPRTFPVREQLPGVVRAAYGGRRSPLRAVRLRGGSKKGVYRLELDDGTSAVAYAWHEAENYWPDAADAAHGHHADPFSAATGLDLFRAAHDRLAVAGVRTPRLLWSGAGRENGPADVAVVEDVPGPTLEHLLRTDLAAAGPVLDRFAAALSRMHACSGPRFGKVAYVDGGGASRGASCPQLVLDRALADLAEGAARDPRLAAAHDRIAYALRTAGDRVAARAGNTLVHGELGPDHVLVDAAGEPVLIDIEGLMYFDIEWEHAFLRLRFPGHYLALRPDAAVLDPHREELYALAMRLSLVAGPLRLLDGDFPDRAFMEGIVEHNLRAALELAGER